MDVAYDAIQDSALKPSTSNPGTNPVEQPPPEESLNAEFQHAFQAVSASPWGSKLGGWFSSARKQGETFVADLQKEAQDAGEQATQGWSSLREQVEKRTRGMSLGAEDAQKSDVKGVVPGEEEVLADSSASKGATAEAEALKTAPESLPADIVKEATTLVASFRVTAAAKLKDLQKAEDAADEALLKFGTNLRNFLRDAVVISAPTSHDASKPRGTDTAGNEVLFETSEPGTGKKVFHGTRLDAQLHAIHTTSTSFTEDPGQGEQWEEWQRTFDIGAQTEAIAKDLEGFEGLRGAMEKLVPEMVEYKVFWMRYYFLRKAVEEDERRRREVLKGAAAAPTDEEDIAWDDEEQDAAPDDPSTPQAASTPLAPAATPVDPDLLHPSAPVRRSHDEKSVADSDASYDMLSGSTTRGAGSPREEKRDAVAGAGASMSAEKAKAKDGEQSDDDWE